VALSSEASDRLLDNAQSSIETVTTSTTLLSETGTAAQKLALWVNDVDSNGERIHGMLDAVRNSNLQISDIAAQVSILAINAKIEAARAGTAGKGFAIVSEAINDLSHKTTQTANRIGEAVAELTEWMARLTSSARENAQGADFVLTSATKTDAALAEMKKRIELVNHDAGELSNVGQRIGKAVAVLTPVTAAAETSVGHVSSGVETASARCDTLVDASEAILQNTVQLGGSSDDNPMILRAQDIGGQVIAALEQALAQGEITEQDLFDDRYRDIEGSNPVQVMTAFTPLMDRVLPPIQEPVLDTDERIVFCAVVDRNGYLPTHNLKFSHPQGPDPAWNAAHSRNRRIF
jgi:methyl-accepting chemotaxis protein